MNTNHRYSTLYLQYEYKTAHLPARMEPEIEGVSGWKGDWREGSAGLAVEGRLGGDQQVVPFPELLEAPETCLERESANLHQRR